MNPDLLTENAPGSLIKASGVWSFIPDPLPPRWSMNDRLWALLMEAREGLQYLEGCGQGIINPNLFIRPLQQREALRSSSIELIEATPEQLLLFGLEAAPADNPKADAWREVANHEAALRLGLELLKEQPISFRLIHQVHRRLLAGVRGEEKSPGEFRRVMVAIGSKDHFVPMPPQHVADAAADLERYIHSEDEIDPLIRVFLTHYQFEAIHPYRDGNGRIGRLLLVLMITQCCRLSQPWLYMSGWFDRTKDEYVERLHRISTRGEWKEWIEYCLIGVARLTRETADRIRRLLELRERYKQTLSARSVPLRLADTLDELFEWPAVTVTRIRENRAIDYKTAKSDAETLVNLGILHELPDQKQRTFLASEIIRIAHED